MAVYVNNIRLDTNSHFYRDFYLDNDDGTPVGLTSYTGASQIRKCPESINAAAQFEVSFIDRDNGHFRLSLPQRKSAILKPGRYVYDVLLTDADGNKSIVVEGMLNASQDISPYTALTYNFEGSTSPQTGYGDVIVNYAGLETDQQQVRQANNFYSFDGTLTTTNNPPVEANTFGVICMGVFNTCSGSVDDLDTFLSDADNIEYVNNYLSGGGVIWFRGERNSCIGNTDSNNVLAKLGTSIRINDNAVNNGPLDGNRSYASLVYTHESISFPSNGIPLNQYSTIQLNSGTSIYNDHNGDSVFAFERKGNGIIVVSGQTLVSWPSDPNELFGAPGHDGSNGEFWVAPTTELYNALRNLAFYE